MLSVVFVRRMGVAGVFLGTVLSTVAVPLFGEVRVLYKYGFSLNPRHFYREMLSYIAVSALCVSACFLLTCRMRITLPGVIARGVASFCASNALLLLFCSHSAYYSPFSDLIKSIMSARRKSKL